MMFSKAKLLFVLLIFCGIPLTALTQSIDWMPMEKAQQEASQHGKKVFIFAEAEWCGYCKKMEQEVFPKESVVDSLEKYFNPVRIDVESSRKIHFNDHQLTQRSLAKKFRVRSTPTMIFLNANGKVLGTQPGFIRAEVFDKLLAFVGQERFKSLEFKAYLKQHGVALE